MKYLILCVLVLISVQSFAQEKAQEKTILDSITLQEYREYDAEYRSILDSKKIVVATFRVYELEPVKVRMVVNGRKQEIVLKDLPVFETKVEPTEAYTSEGFIKFVRGKEKLKNKKE